MKWNGADEIAEGLALLSSSKKRPVPSATIKQVADLAARHHAEYKMVVYEFEKFIRKSSAEDKLTGLLLVDSLCRSSKDISSKIADVYSARFALRMKDTFGSCSNIPASDKATVRKIAEDWVKRGLLPDEGSASLIEDVCGGDAGHLPSEARSSHSKSHSSASASASVSATGAATAASSSSYALSTHAKAPEVIPTDPRLKRGQAAASSAVGAVAAGAVEEAVKASDPTGATAAPAESASSEVGAAGKDHKVTRGVVLKLCPFASSCPFGNNCRYSHSEWTYKNSACTWLPAAADDASASAVSGSISGSSGSGTGPPLFVLDADWMTRPSVGLLASNTHPFALRAAPASVSAASDEQEIDLQSLVVKRRLCRLSAPAAGGPALVGADFKISAIDGEDFRDILKRSKLVH